MAKDIAQLYLVDSSTGSQLHKPTSIVTQTVAMPFIQAMESYRTFVPGDASESNTISLFNPPPQQPRIHPLHNRIKVINTFFKNI